MADRDQLLELTALFKTVIKRFRAEWAKGIEDDMTVTQFRLLQLLKTEGQKKTMDIAEALMVTPGAVTGMADKLIAGGLVVRKKSELDRRVAYLEITEKGMKRADELLDKQIQTVGNLFRDFPDEDIEHLKRIYKNLLKNLGEKE
ncbi:MarR family winged helix-turn-helix transcriptional regulator [Paenibacillus tarimensis]|uniref:MarR family winged helix-turn-helix transcriptional regulator n=1 Tax=Paenibacillus tarimensis TaxID=416012 RepID=UPI001F41A947|nr:MarR family transcriptional regulator [Paenibacillus tarimensis]MCF2942886.1 MarR family transcriptional regulator [Paenibacillus tarimensis]